jgi:hypothetical protein
VKVIEINEQAVVECLRYLIPFANIVTSFALGIAECHPKPQMIGYFMEYLVAFALVMNNDKNAANNIHVYHDLPFMYFKKVMTLKFVSLTVCVDLILCTSARKPKLCILFKSNLSMVFLNKKL